MTHATTETESDDFELVDTFVSRGLGRAETLTDGIVAGLLLDFVSADDPGQALRVAMDAEGVIAMRDGLQRLCDELSQAIDDMQSGTPRH